MSISKIATAAFMAVSLAAVPTLAEAAPAASKLSIAAPVSRAGAQTAKGNKAIGGGIIIAVLAAAAVVAGIVIASDGNSSSN